MAARAIWKGILKIGTTGVPVKLYSAVVDRAVHFHMLDAKTRSRVTQQMISPESGKPVERADIHKAYEVERGRFVTLDEKELTALEPKESRDINTSEFLPLTAIDHQWFDRPYWLGPDGDEPGYFALARALSAKQRQGLARWVMRKQQYVGALRSDGDHLMIITLRPAEEVLLPDERIAPAGRALDKRELRMAEQLVDALAGEFNPEEFRDEYRDRLLHFLQAKAKGTKTKLSAVKSKRATTSLTAALSRSLEIAENARDKKAA